MAQTNPFRRGAERHDLRKAAGLTERYLDRTRSKRLARSPRSPFGLRFFMLVAASLLGVFALVMFDEATSAFAAYTVNLPPVSDLSAGKSFKTTQILDRNGKLLYEIDNKNGGRSFPIALSRVSPLLIDATIATEDKNFYTGPGLSLIHISEPTRLGMSSYAVLCLNK